MYVNLMPTNYIPSKIYKEVTRDRYLVPNPMLYQGVIQQSILMTQVPDRSEIIDKYYNKHVRRSSEVI